MTSGATGPITKAISARRSHRRQWRIFECIAMIILDAILVIVSFRLAYRLRYEVFFNNQLLATFRYNLHGIENNSHTTLKVPPDALTPFSYFQSLEIGIVIGLILIFTFRGLYNIRLTGTWFRQVWTIVSSTTLGLAFLITYYFICYTYSLLCKINRLFDNGHTLSTWSRGNQTACGGIWPLRQNDYATYRC